MDNEIDIDEIEQEQLDYLRRNYDKTLNIPNSTNMNLDILQEPIDDRIILTPEQEKKLVQEVLKQTRVKPEVNLESKHKFSLATYFDILTESFIDIMDDILNFNGDISTLSSIITKGERPVFFGTIIFFISLFLIFKNRAPTTISL